MKLKESHQRLKDGHRPVLPYFHHFKRTFSKDLFANCSSSKTFLASVANILTEGSQYSFHPNFRQYEGEQAISTN